MKRGPTPAEDKTPGSPCPSHRGDPGAALAGLTKTPFPRTRKKLIQFETSLPNKDREQKKCFRKLKKSFIRSVKEQLLLHRWYLTEYLPIRLPAAGFAQEGCGGAAALL